jgi:RNase P subunit RPR2
MDRSEARLFFQALRTGNKKAVAEFLRMRALKCRIVCEHCRESVLPLARRFDFDELVVTAECSLCGKINRMALKNWDGAGALKPPVS